MAKKFDQIDNTTLHNVTVENVMSDAFGKYAKYIIQDRAIPDIRDGLKPVQRRIVYAMNDLGITHDKPHKKSARSVGEVIGKYHPHGDTSIYDAMVRMSQDWKNNCPLIDMHGNNGSLDNDPAAAMRYTESRLSSYAETMVSNIKKNTVGFIENFDGSEVEPTVLPCLLPNLLLNGAQGIAAGYATNIPTFNLIELLDSAIARIDSPNCRLDTILNIMPGPDFPTKGLILNNSNIREIYETGRGKIIVRATMEQVGKRQIYVRDIPYETVKCDIIDEINECAEEVESLGIDIARDESDSSGVSICIEMKPNFNYDLVKNYLYKNTSLQVNYNANMISIRDRKPYLMSILGYLDAYIAHVNDVITKSTQFDLNKAKTRREIVTGLIKAISIIDDVVSLIRRSSDKADAKNGLMTKMHFSELQSEAIVSLRLYKLSNTDLNELQDELKELEAAITEFELILSDKTYRDNKIKTILRGYKKEFGIERQTQFSNESSTDIKIEVADVIEDRDNYLVITKDGYLKNIPTKSFAASEYSELKIKEGDIPVAQFESNQRNKLILITNKGNYVSIPVFKIESTKWKEAGIHINSIITLDHDEKIINAFDYANNVSDPRVLVLASKKGQIKRTTIEDLGISKLIKSSTVMKLQEGDELISCVITPNSEFVGNICVVTEEGRALAYPINQISIIGKNGAGVANTSAEENIAAIFAEEKPFVLIACKQGMKRIRKEDIQIGNRTNSPKFILSQVKTNPFVVIDAFSCNMNDVINTLTDEGKWMLIKCSDITIADKDSRISSYKGKTFVFVNYIEPLGKAKASELVNEEESIEIKKDVSLFDN